MARTTRRDRYAPTARVQLTYDVDVAGETQRKELPFVIGVLADFAGNPDGGSRRLRDREFVEIARDNFDAALRALRPRLVFKVDNKLTNDESKLGIELRFERLEDFDPQHVAMQVAPLRQLIATRQRLIEIRNAIRRNASALEREKIARNGGEATRSLRS